MSSGTSAACDAADATATAAGSGARPGTAAARAVLLVLFFASGVATLVYQVLWQRQLTALFGADAHATAATLTTFFGGLALGSGLVARAGGRGLRDPLLTYALLEIGIAVAALLPAALAPSWNAALPMVSQVAPPGTILAAALKLVATALFLLPATMLMGATLPVLGQVLVRERAELAATAGLLLGCNTLGAAAGAVAAGFWLPFTIGTRATTACAMTLNVAVGGMALLLRWRLHPCGEPRGSSGPAAAVARRPRHAILSDGVALLVAAASGFATLALEVLWTRMFALVLNNSAAAFAAILVVLLLGLACGALVASRVCRGAGSAEAALLTLLVLAGVAVGATPHALAWATGGLAYLRNDGGYAGYLGAVVALVAVVTAVPAVLCGTILPCAIRIVRNQSRSAAALLGRISAVNTAGGIAGALATGFVILPNAGLWGGIRAITVLYLVLAIALASRLARVRTLVAAAVALVAFVTVLDPARLPVVKLDRSKGESLHEVWQGAHGVVAVVARPDDLRIEVDGSYTLGGRSARAYERTQADLPLLVAGHPRSAFFLGLGTGITAAAALRHPLDELTSAELIPEVVTAARTYFRDDAGALFEDSRSRIVVGDGRQILGAEPRRYDVIVSDLFVPWHAGTASLYSREHFATVRSRLNEGGTFALWLPLYQMSRREFDVVARTISEIFPVVTLWRGDFLTRQPIVALIGQDAGARLDPAAMAAAMRNLGLHPGASDESLEALSSLLYAGNVTASAALFRDAAVHTDDRPLLEMLAARTQSDVRADEARWLTGAELERLYEALARTVPPDLDPYLARLDAEQRSFVAAGRILYRFLVALVEGRAEEARSLREQFRDLVPFGTYEMFRGRMARADEMS